MSDEHDRKIQRRLTSPRSAAVAGIIFSLLMMTSLTLIAFLAGPENIDPDWIAAWAKRSTMALSLVPFAGIAFLWFTGVMRDRLGEREDRLFSTVFLGSGVIFVVILFIWAASFAAILRIYEAADSIPALAESQALLFAFAFKEEIIRNYGLRMAGVYMLSIGTLWSKTGVVPRWLSILTYVVAIAFLLFAGTTIWFLFVFPGWVLLVSAYILVLNYRFRTEAEPSA
jgi:MFS family permease